MATQNINIGVNVSDNGTAKKVVKNFQEITSAATQAQQAAQGISAGPVKSTMAPGGTPGSRRASEPSGSQGMMSSEQYGNLRGSAGMTGASARDFANQAQGLGGLVRLYATYAANIFAVSAAFTALSNAMDTANMIKGLDQLGASSGVALGSLSKRLASATDNAISLREAMAATVKASSSGMNSDQILRMGTVAKQASIALGVDMSDAISRISRGITKLEPELLDELGLFTKTGKAAEDYAKSVGKSVTELTDFERRQAFANAVLTEGEKKFGDIDAKANSYTVLLASIKDASFSALNAINTVLGPVIGLLSQSPGALIAGMVGLATVVIKQAVPALGQLRENLEFVAESAASDAYDKASKAQSTFAKALDLELQKVEQGADAKLAIVEKSEAELAKAKFTGLKNSVEVEKLLNSTVQDLREEDFAAASEVARQKEEDAKRWSQSASKSWQARGTAAQEEANITRQLVKEVREHKIAEESLAAAKEKAEKTVRSGAQAYTVLGQNLRLAEAANTQSVKKSIVSNAAYNASLIGLRGSAVLLKNEIDNSGLALTRLGTAALYARGGIAILTGAIATMGAAITKALNIVGILVTVFSLLDTFAGSKKVSVAMKDLSDSIDIANSSSKTFTDTMAASYKGNMLAVSSLEAQSTALNEVSVSITKASEASAKAQKAVSQGNWYDKTVEFFKDVAGFGIGDKFQETLGQSINSAVEGLSNSAEGEEVKRKFADIFNIDPKSAKFEKQLKDRIEALELAPDSSEAKKSIELLKQLGTSAGIAASRAREFKDALDASVAATKALGDTYKVTNPITTFVETSLTSLKKLDLNLQEPKVEAFAENLLDLSEKLANNPIFGPQQSAYLSSYSKQIKELNTELTDSKKQLKDLQELGTPSSTVDKAELRRNLVAATKDKPVAERLNPQTAIKVADDMIEAMDASYNLAVSNLQKVVKASESGLRTIGAKFRDSIESGAKYNLELLITQLQQTLAEGSTKFIQGILSGLSSKGIIGAAEQEKKLKLQELDAQRTSVTTMRDLIAAMKVNSATVALASARTEKEAADKAYYALPETATLEDRNKATSRVVSANVDMDQATKNFNLVTKAVKNPIGALNDLKGSFGIVGEAVRANVMGIAQSMAGFTVQLQKFKSEEEQIVLDSQVKGVQEFYIAQQEVLDARKQALDVDTKALQINVQNKSLTEAQTAAEENTLKTRAAQLTYDESILKANKQYAESSVLIAALETKAMATKDKELLTLVESAKETRNNALATAQINAEKLKGVDIDKIGADRRAKALQKDLSQISKNYELTQALTQLENTKGEIALEQSSKELELYSQAYGLSQNYVITQRTALEQESARLALTTAINQAEQAIAKRKKEAAAEKTALGPAASPEALAIIDEETTRQQALSNITVAGLSLQYNNKIAILEKTREINLEQERYNQLLTSAGDFANNLKMGFEGAAESSQKFATALGDMATTMAELTVNAEKRANSEAKLANDLAAARKSNDPLEIAAAEGVLAEQKKKNAKQELADDIKVLNSSKKFFKEKTSAYKVLDATEKALRIKSMAAEVKNLAEQIKLWWTGVSAKVAAATAGEAGATAATGAGFASRLPIYIKEIYASWGKLGPWMVGAAALFIASKLGGSGGGTLAAGFMAEDQQKVQGTGQAFGEGGRIVTRAGGVTGDDKALADSVSSSIEMLSKDFFGIFDTDNSMVIKALKGIEENTGELSKALLGGTSGLFGGNNPFGVTEGSSSSVLGFSKSSTSIADQGITVKGTLSDIIRGGGEINQYLNTIRKSSSFWGLSKSTSFNTAVEDLNKTAPKAVAAIRNIFIGVSDALEASSEYFYGAGSATDTWAKDIVRNVEIDLRASSKDLSAVEFAEAVKSEVSVQLNKAALQAFPELVGFNQLGEEMYETATRLMKDSQVIKDGFSMIGLASKGLTGSVTETVTSFFGLINKTITRDISSGSGSLKDTTQLEQDLLKASGGADKFAEGMSSIFNDFFDDSTRYTQTLGRLNKVFQDSNITLPKTKAEYLNLLRTTTDVKQLGTLIKYTKEYNNLISLQTAALGDTIGNFEKFADSLRSFRDGLLLGSQSILSPLEKYTEAERQYEVTFAKAIAGDEKAQGEFQSAAQAFLTASGNYFASSGQNIANVNRVLADTNLGIMEAESQIDISKDQRTLLTSIDSNIAILAGVPQMAAGGRASGLTIVGERGPELVDFSYPGMVYPADQTRGMFAPQANMSSSIGQVVQELRQVKQELAQLRKEQQQQTGDLIVSNYDANNRAAEAVTTEVANAATLKEWQQRNKAAVI